VTGIKQPQVIFFNVQVTKKTSKKLSYNHP